MPIGYPIPVSPESIHTSNMIQTEQVVLMYLGFYRSIYITAFEEEEAMNLKDSNEWGHEKG